MISTRNYAPKLSRSASLNELTSASRALIARSILQQSRGCLVARTYDWTESVPILCCKIIVVGMQQSRFVTTSITDRTNITACFVVGLATSIRKDLARPEIKTDFQASLERHAGVQNSRVANPVVPQIYPKYSVPFDRSKSQTAILMVAVFVRCV